MFSVGAEGLEPVPRLAHGDAPREVRALSWPNRL